MDFLMWLITLEFYLFWFSLTLVNDLLLDKFLWDFDNFGVP